MNSGNKKEEKSCLRTAGGSEYTFLCSLTVVCLLFWVVPFLGQIRPALHRPLFPKEYEKKKITFLAVSFILVLLKCAFTAVTC